MRQNIEQITLLRINDLLHFLKLVFSKTLLCQAFQELCSGRGEAPDRAELFLILEKLRQLAKDRLHELLRRHRRTVRMPEAGCDHVLNCPLFAVSKLYLRFSFANARSVRTFRRALAQVSHTHKGVT